MVLEAKLLHNVTSMKASCTMKKFSLLVKITHISAISDISASKVFFLLLPPVSLFCGLALGFFDFADFVPHIFLT